MPKSYTCSLKTHIRDNHPKFHSLLDLICAKIGKTKCAIIPSDTDIAKITKDIKAIDITQKDAVQKYNAIKSAINSHMFVSHAIDSSFKGGVVTTKGGCTVQVSAVKDGKFTVISGADGKTKAECKLSDVHPAPLMRDPSKKRELSAATIASGSIACGSKASPKDKLEGGHMESVNADRKLEFKSTLTMEIIRTSAGLDVDGFAPVMAGLLKFLDGKASAQEDCKRICQYLYPCAIQSYYTIIQPYNSTQLIEDSLLREWMGAPYFCTDYAAQFNAFIAKYSGETRANREKVVESLKALPAISTIDEQFRSIYSSNCVSVFGTGCNDKLWADNLAFEISQLYKSNKTMKSFVIAVSELVKGSFDGRDKDSQIRFGNRSFWSMFRSSREPIMDFLRGDYMLHFSSGVFMTDKAPTEPYPYLKAVLALNK